MTLIIVAILLLSYLLIATEKFTNVNKAAVAIFAGTVGWMLYIGWGADYVMSQHATDYLNFLDGVRPNSMAVKEYIASSIFLKYVGRASEIVVFLLATMTIVEILNNNGCFDFIRQLLRTRNSRKMLWMLSLATFVISANLDNLTTTVMMLTMMHGVVPSRRQRFIYGAAIVLAANYGGMLTVIGDPLGLVLWNKGAVTATAFSMRLILPCLCAWILPTWWLGRSLPERVDTEWITLPYRGDDTRLRVWQRQLMLVVGIVSLWLIPTFHNITRLSPFVGALCVLSVLWVVNEVFNRKLINTEQILSRRTPHMLQYGVSQMMLYVMGIMLALGVVEETGAFDWLWEQMVDYGPHTWMLSVASGIVSTVLDNFASAMAFTSLNQTAGVNDPYWTLVAYCTTVGGNILPIGSMAGMALLMAERMHVGWYFKEVGVKVIVGGAIGLAVIFIL